MPLNPLASLWPGQQQPVCGWEPDQAKEEPAAGSELKPEDLFILQTLPLIKREGIPTILLQAPLFLPNHLILLLSTIAMTKSPYQDMDHVVLTV